MPDSVSPSKVLRQSDHRWTGVPLKAYKTDGTHFRGVIRQTLIGEGEGEERPGFMTRYFEVEPGGYTSLERHEHPHVVVIVRGRGEVILDRRLETVEPLDCVYIAPECLHQFHTVGDEPLGFLCIVDRQRDRPRLADGDDLQRLRGNPEVAAKIKT